MATERIDTAEQLAAAEAAVRDLTEQVEQVRTRAEAAEAELREARQREGRQADLIAAAIRATEDAERDASAVRAGLLRIRDGEVLGEIESKRLVDLVYSAARFLYAAGKGAIQASCGGAK